jgi:hypothetical protein
MVSELEHTKLVDEHLESHPEDSPCHKVALRGALPVNWGWSGCYGVYPDGSVVFYNDEAKSWSTTVKRAQWLITLSLVARRHPQYQDLLPRRPINATDCSECNGTGTPDLAKNNEVLRNLLCGNCYALGWIPAGGWGTIAPRILPTHPPQP